MPSDIYEDVLLWSEEQAALLRRLAAGERVNADIDWPALIEEVEGLGRSELRACESNLRQALVHLIKLARFPEEAAAHWRGETATFLTEAQSCFSPSMRRKIDLNRIYKQARHLVDAAAEPGGSVGPLPDDCPVTLGELLLEGAEVRVLETRFN